MFSSFNIVDLVVLIFSLIFVITALLRGLIKEVFAFSNWIIAFSLSYMLAPYLSDFFKNYIKTKIVADLSARGLIFLVVFITIALSTSGLCKSLRESTPKILDKSLGVCFAIFKTLIIFGCIYSIYFNMYGFLLGNKLNAKEEIEDPKILTEAKSYNTIKLWGKIVDPVVKLFFDAIAKNIEFAIVKSFEFEEKINKTVDDKSLDAELLNNSDKQNLNSQDILKNPKQLDNQIEPGYDQKDIDKINNLIDKIDKK
jgi:uncharacterized membrane protein required for colicin V production